MPRPRVSKELREEVKARTKDEFSVPEEHVTFESRVRVLLEENDDLRRDLREERRDDEPITVGGRKYQTR